MDATTSGWRALGENDVVRAYPLVAAVDGAAVSLGRWRRMIRAWQPADGTNLERGAMAYFGAFASVLALFLFRIDLRPAMQRRLLVPRVWLVELGSSRHLLRQTLAAIDAQAECCSCRTVALNTGHPGVRWLAEVLALDRQGDHAVRRGRLLLRRVDAITGDR